MTRWESITDVPDDYLMDISSSGRQYVTTETYTDNSSWPAVVHRTTFAGKFQPVELEWDSFFKNQKGEDKMVYLSDLVIYFEMTKVDLDEIKKIMAEKDWKERLMVFLLAHAVVKEGIKFEHLGYESDE